MNKILLDNPQKPTLAEVVAVMALSGLAKAGTRLQERKAAQWRD